MQSTHQEGYFFGKNGTPALTLDAQRLMLGSLCISLGIFKIPNALLCNIVFIKR